MRLARLPWYANELYAREHAYRTIRDSAARSSPPLRTSYAFLMNSPVSGTIWRRIKRRSRIKKKRRFCFETDKRGGGGEEGERRGSVFERMTTFFSIRDLLSRSSGTRIAEKRGQERDFSSLSFLFFSIIIRERKNSKFSRNLRDDYFRPLWIIKKITLASTRFLENAWKNACPFSIVNRQATGCE